MASMRLVWRALAFLGALLTFVILGAAHAQQPLTLGAALALVQSSPTVEAARVALEDARRELAGATDLVRANLSASGDGTFDLSDQAAPGASEQFGLSMRLNATFNVAAFGPQAEAVARATNQVERAENALRDAKAQTTVDVARLFLAALRAEQQLANGERRLELAQMDAGATRARQQAGAASQSDLLQAEIAVAGAGNDLTGLRAEHGYALLELAQTLDLGPLAVDALAPFTAGPLALDLPVQTAAQVERRSDVRSARLASAEAQLAVNAARRQAAPSADLSASFNTSSGGSSLQLGAAFDTTNFQPSASVGLGLGTGGSGQASRSSVAVGVGVSVPLDARNSRAVAAAEQRAAEAELAVERALERAVAEVARGQDNLSQAAAQAELTQRLLDQARLALDRARTQHEGGVISIIDLTRAELSAEDAALQAARAEDNHLLAAMDLARALARDPLEVVP